MFDATRFVSRAFLKTASTLLVVLALHPALRAAAAPQPSAREQALAAIVERSYFAPKESLRKLALLDAGGAAPTLHEQALQLRATGSALWRTGDYAATIALGRQLQEFGRRYGNRDHECLGLLQQVYGRFMLGQIGAAYQLTEQARAIAPSLLTAETRVRTMLTVAQVADEQRRRAAGDAALAEALRAAGADRRLLFMAVRQQAARAVAAGEHTVAAASVERLLALASPSPYPEQMVRAKYVEYNYASAAGLTGRAAAAMSEVIRLMRTLALDESLGSALIEYADFQLKRKHFGEAALLSHQALQLDAVRSDADLARTARFNHGVARIRLGEVDEGKREIDALFAGVRDRRDLLDLVPEYMAALAHSGDVDGTIRAGALYAQVQSEDALRRATDEDRARRRLEKLEQDRQLRTLEAERERNRRAIWQAAFAAALVGAAGILLLYRRLRATTRLLATANEQLSFTSNRDFLTGLFNRRYVDGIAAGLQAVDTGLALLVDVDHFKRINDCHGHAAGDQVLKEVAQRLSMHLGGEGFVARWGGEEFLALLPGLGAERMTALAGTLLDAVAATPIPLGDETIHVTVSVGFCPLGLAREDGSHWEQVLRKADEALYQAKARGRNRAYGASQGGFIELAQGKAQRAGDGIIRQSAAA